VVSAVSERDTSPQLANFGELRAFWRERHLCLQCRHHLVCKMANALDPNLLVVISQCLAFETAELEAPDALDAPDADWP
jgi:hypothetical protein